MRWGAIVLLLLLAGCGARSPSVPPARAHPLRVMSINACTDQLVLALLPPARIASVTWLARDPGGSVMAAEALRVPVNHGHAEEVLAERPDLVVADSFSSPALRATLRRLGWPMVEMDEAASLDEIRRVTRQIAAAVDERARGEALIARMDAELAELARDPGPPIRVAAWDRSGIGAGPGTLYDAVLTAAGAHNVGRGPGLAAGRPDVERLLQADPALLIEGTREPGGSLGDAVTGHPLVRRRWRGRTLTVRSAYYACGTPFIADAALRLRAELRATAGRAGPAR